MRSLQGVPLPPPELGIGGPWSPMGGRSREKAGEHQVRGAQRRGAARSGFQASFSILGSGVPDPLLLGQGRTLV